MLNPLVEMLCQRNSMRFVTAPGPSPQELQQALQAAMAAPDHGKLTPWRFKIIQGEHVKTFFDFAISLRQASDNPLPEDRLEATKSWVYDVPLVIAVACYIDYSAQRIPEHERLLASGCATMNVINALHAMGYGVFWSTGLATEIDEFQTGLGFNPLDYRFMGYLCVGTPKMPIAQKVRAAVETVCEPWTGPLVG